MENLTTFIFLSQPISLSVANKMILDMEDRPSLNASNLDLPLIRQDTAPRKMAHMRWPEADGLISCNLVLAHGLKP